MLIIRRTYYQHVREGKDKNEDQDEDGVMIEKGQDSDTTQAISIYQVNTQNLHLLITFI